jgi:hypothetical protein
MNSDGFEASSECDGPALAMEGRDRRHQMFSERGIKAARATFQAASSFPAWISASRIVAPLLLAETAAFAVGAASGKIPMFLFTAIRALLTF